MQFETLRSYVVDQKNTLVKKWTIFSVCNLCVWSIVFLKKKFISRNTKMKSKAILIVLFIIIVLQMMIDCSAEGNIDGFSL